MNSFVVIIIAISVAAILMAERAKAESLGATPSAATFKIGPQRMIAAILIFAGLVAMIGFLLHRQTGPADSPVSKRSQ
jgi:hypothetical protein